MYLTFEFIVNLFSAVSSDTIVVYRFYPGNEALEMCTLIKKGGKSCTLAHLEDKQAWVKTQRHQLLHWFKPTDLTNYVVCISTSKLQ